MAHAVSEKVAQQPPPEGISDNEAKLQLSAGEWNSIALKADGTVAVTAFVKNLYFVLAPDGESE